MVDRRRDLRFAHEPAPDRLVLEQPRGDDLQRDGPVQRELRRPIDHAHPATPGHGLDPVTGEN